MVISSSVTTSVATSWSLIHTWHWLLHLATDTDLKDADVSGCNDITKGKAHCHGLLPQCMKCSPTPTHLCPYHIPNMSFFAKFSAP